MMSLISQSENLINVKKNYKNYEFILYYDENLDGLLKIN